MEVRIVQLLGSVISTTSTYALARLEFAMKHPEWASPPLIERLDDSSEDLQERWGRVERQLEAARSFLIAHDDVRRKRAVYDPSFAWLQRCVRELDQYARAMRWVLTVEDGR